MRLSVYSAPMTVKIIVEIVRSKLFPQQPLLFNLTFSLKRCNEVISDIEKVEVKNLILCHHGSHLHSQDACLRGYTSQRDLQEHVKRRHEQPPPPPPPSQSVQARLDPPLQLLPPTHPPAAVFPGLGVDSQQQPPPLPPPLMTFPPMNVPGMPPPPLYDMRFRPPAYGHPPPQQQFVPPQQQYRPHSYPPNRPLY